MTPATTWSPGPSLMAMDLLGSSGVSRVRGTIRRSHHPKPRGTMPQSPISRLVQPLPVTTVTLCPAAKSSPTTEVFFVRRTFCHSPRQMLAAYARQKMQVVVKMMRKFESSIGAPNSRQGPGFAGIKRDHVGFFPAFAAFSERVLSVPLLTLVSRQTFPQPIREHNLPAR